MKKTIVNGSFVGYYMPGKVREDYPNASITEGKETISVWTFGWLSILPIGLIM